jgi:hypothetical protein
VVPDRSSSQTHAAASAGMWKLPRSVKIQVHFHAVKAVSVGMWKLPRSVKIQVLFHSVKAAAKICKDSGTFSYSKSCQY